MSTNVAGVCERCVAGHILPGDPRGTYVGSAYYAQAPERSHTDGTPSRAIVLLTDIFGLPLVNCRLMADRFSDVLGCDVWVPDLFNGKPPFEVSALAEKLPDIPGQSMSIWEKIHLYFLIILRIPAILSLRGVADKRALDFVKKIREEKKYDKIGAVGYCFGGSLSIVLATEDCVDSVVVVHPGQTNIDQIKAMKVPSSWACAEEDHSFGPKKRLAAEAAFKEREGKDNAVEYEFVDYPGTCHGFAARPNLAIEHIKEAYEKAFQQAVDWFNKTIAG